MAESRIDSRQPRVRLASGGKARTILVGGGDHGGLKA
jgi:hypothetical protein